MRFLLSLILSLSTIATAQESTLPKFGEGVTCEPFVEEYSVSRTVSSKSPDQMAWQWLMTNSLIQQELLMTGVEFCQSPESQAALSRQETESESSWREMLCYFKEPHSRTLSERNQYEVKAISKGEDCGSLDQGVTIYPNGRLQVDPYPTLNNQCNDHPKYLSIRFSCSRMVEHLLCCRKLKVETR